MRDMAGKNEVIKRLRLRLRAVAREYRRRSYGVPHLHHDRLQGQRLIDCSLGTNPDGPPEPILNRIKEGISQEVVGSYPPYPYAEFCEKIAQHWRSAGCDVSAECIVPSVGSFGFLCLIAKAFLEQGSVVLGWKPQFPDYPSTFELYGAGYETVGSSSQEPQLRNWLKFDAEELSQHIRGEHTFVYIDNPNNPTGQVIPLEEIELIVGIAESLGVLVVVDEAYGEFMPDSNSAVSLLSRYENVIVARSFSKGYGLAGLRVGYGVVPPWLARHLREIEELFQVNAIALECALTVLGERDFLRTSCERNSEFKRRLLQLVLRSDGRLVMAQTDPFTPICVLGWKGGARSFFEALLERGVVTAAGSAFPGLGTSSVRVRRPAEGEINHVLERLEEVCMNPY